MTAGVTGHLTVEAAPHRGTVTMTTARCPVNSNTMVSPTDKCPTEAPTPRGTRASLQLSRSTPTMQASQGRLLHSSMSGLPTTSSRATNKAPSPAPDRAPCLAPHSPLPEGAPIPSSPPRPPAPLTEPSPGHPQGLTRALTRARGAQSSSACRMKSSDVPYSMWSTLEIHATSLTTS